MEEFRYCQIRLIKILRNLTKNFNFDGGRKAQQLWKWKTVHTTVVSLLRGNDPDLCALDHLEGPFLQVFVCAKIGAHPVNLIIEWCSLLRKLLKLSFHSHLGGTILVQKKEIFDVHLEFAYGRNGSVMGKMIALMGALTRRIAPRSGMGIQRSWSWLFWRGLWWEGVLLGRDV